MLITRELTIKSNLSRLIHPVQFVKCWQIFLELNSKLILYRSSGKKKSTSCVHVRQKREMRQFHVVIMQWRQRNVQKSVILDEVVVLFFAVLVAVAVAVVVA